MEKICIIYTCIWSESRQQMATKRLPTSIRRHGMVNKKKKKKNCMKIQNITFLCSIITILKIKNYVCYVMAGCISVEQKNVQTLCVCVCLFVCNIII